MRATKLLPSRLPSDFSRGSTRASFILSRMHQIPKVLYSLAMLGAVADRACSCTGFFPSCTWCCSWHAPVMKRAMDQSFLLHQLNPREK
jgi:hypothetical protein